MSDMEAAWLGAALLNHLWQSTLFAGVIWLLALLLRNHSARVRYWLWLAASLKFLVPFFALSLLGSAMVDEPQVVTEPFAPVALALASDLAAPAVAHVDWLDPLADRWAPEETTGDVRTLLPVILAAVWAIGVLAMAGRWIRRWVALRRVVGASTAQTDIAFPVPVRSSRTQMEPVVAGILHPVLLLPVGLDARLTPEQLGAVLAHERRHLRFRDNLTAALHMVVEAMFWFHPLVWWIGARLIAEREQDCDEQVLSEGHQPAHYAEGILRVCEHYVASRLSCASGVSGADLRRRVAYIARNPVVLQLTRRKQLLFMTAAGAAMVFPVAAGTLFWPAMRTESLLPSTRARSLYQLGQVQSARIGDAYFKAIAGAADARLPACTGRTALVVERQAALAATASRLNATDGEFVLLYAVSANSLRDARRLLASGAARTADSILYQRSLMHAAARDADAAMLQLLLGAGIDVNGLSAQRVPPPRYAPTPLQEAISHGRFDNVQWLIAHGAQVNAGDGRINSPLVNALTCRDQRMIDALLQAGAVPGAREQKIAASLGLRLTASRESPAATAMQPVAPPAGPASNTANADLPPGWMQPTSSDLWLDPARRSSPTLYATAVADFDGDGQQDQAAVFVSRDGMIESLALRLAAAPTWQHLASVGGRKEGAPLRMGVALQPPGTYATVCAKGLGARCTPEQPTEVRLEHPGILFFRMESSARVFYWNAATRDFKSEWISD